jgi:hypothetical protein
MIKLKLDLQSVDSNAYMLLGYFRKTAKRAGWTQDEIEKITEEAMSDDYDHLIQTLLSVSE